MATISIVGYVLSPRSYKYGYEVFFAMILVSLILFFADRIYQKKMTRKSAVEMQKKDSIKGVKKAKKRKKKR